MESVNPARQLQTQAAQAMQQGDGARARQLLEQARIAAPEDPGINTNLAILCMREGQLTRALELVDAAINADPHLYPAVLHKGLVLQRMGQERDAISAFSRGLAQAGDLNQVPQGLRDIVQHAHAAVSAFEARLEPFLAGETASIRDQFGDEALLRLDEAIAIRHGKKPRQLQEPTFFYFPGLPQRAFYEREEFPWLEEIEAGWQTIREEFLTIMEQDAGFRPYVEKPDDVPLAQWRELNNSLDWGAYHLYKEGVRQDDNCVRCPRTVELIEALPLSRIADHEPEVFFSLLKPGTHIPPHTGAINTRLVVHLPLIVPPKCRFRAGNHVREWKPGESLIFDDTMEHEAWNDSDELRVVFIYNIWNPYLTEAEREGIAATVTALSRFER